MAVYHKANFVVSFPWVQILYSSEQSRELDRRAIAAGTPGILLMKRAGRAAFLYLCRRWPGVKSLIVICGAGNNAGDGYIVAALAIEQGLPVQVFYTKPPNALRNEARDAADYALRADVICEPVESLMGRPIQNGAHSLVVDALLGTGVRGVIKPFYASVIQWLNSQDIPVLSLDVPSGLNSDTGAGDPAVKASATLSFLCAKRGLFTGAGAACSGDRLLDDLGAVGIKTATMPDVRLLEASPLIGKLQRPRDAHKNMFGHVAVLGGDQGMAGAALLCCEAALSGGAGLVSLFTRPEHTSAANVRLPEVMTQALASNVACTERLAAASVLALGPGMGQANWGKALLRETLTLALPKVIDADALNIVAQHPEILKGASHVLTPHPGEAARLLQCHSSEIQNDRYSAVRRLQQRFGGVVVLKGAGTLIADDAHIWVCRYGNPGMSVGGMGDVLCGLIAALLAQGLTLLEATQLGVEMHSKAADNMVALSGEIGLRASDLVSEIRVCLNDK